MSQNPVEQSELLRGLRQDVLKEVATFSREVEYPRGATIFQEGDKAQNVCVLAYGLVTLRIETPGSTERVRYLPLRRESSATGEPRNAAYQSYRIHRGR